MSDQIRTSLGLAGTVRVLEVRAEAVGAELVDRHHLGGFPARLGVEGVLATVLLSAHIKGDERLLVQVQGQNPTFAFLGEVRADGDVRARLTPAQIAPSASLSGMLMAIKHDAQREVYRGVAEISGPGFETALDRYLAQSQQTWGVVRLGSRFGTGRHPQLAAGVLVERLPGLLSDEEFQEWTAPLRELPLEELLAELERGELLGNPLMPLETRPLRFACPCSGERVEATLLSMGATELRSIHAEQGEAEVTCNFCNERYVIPGTRLLRMAEQLEGLLN